ncbi:hypothetical protein D3C72_2434420 [compost metagenome]
MPAATWVTWRSAPLDPTDTVSARSAVEFAPTATLLAAEAAAFVPIATPWLALTEADGPTASPFEPRPTTAESLPSPAPSALM